MFHYKLGCVEGAAQLHTRDNMASFRPNPNAESELWIERAAFENSMFRIWHLMFFAFSGFVALSKLFICNYFFLLDF